MRRPRCSSFATSTIVGSILGCCVLASAGCKGGRGGKSELAHWVDEPSNGTTAGNTIKIPELGVVFTVPDTRYVFRSCSEASHTPQGSERWVPVITCTSTAGSVFGSGEGAEEGGGDSLGSEEDTASSGQEIINTTIFATHKSRPLDERSVSWMENQYQQAGLKVEELSYQADFQKKSGIYAKLHVMDGGTPTREILQFMFPREDIVFIARTEYPFGDSRAIEQDWSYIVWNFDYYVPAEAE